MNAITENVRLLRTSISGLVLRRLTVIEMISRPTQIEAEVLSLDANVQAADMIGKKIVFSVHPSGGDGARYFHGVVRTFRATRRFIRDYTSYEIEATPDLWNLLRTIDCCIFQNESVKEIVEKLLKEGQIEDKNTNNLPATPKRDYCTQYNETDLAFIQRLLSETGCGYYFKPEPTKSTLVFTSSNSGFEQITNAPLVRRTDEVDDFAVTDWQTVSEIQPGQQAQEDHDNLSPTDKHRATTTTVIPFSSRSAGTWQVFRWPGLASVAPETDHARREVERSEARTDVSQASSRTPALFAGGKASIKRGVEPADPSDTWLITSVRHTAFDDSNFNNAGATGYANTFTAIPVKTPWRDPQAWPRPAIPSVQSATVTGKDGEEIDVDKYGRIRVRFRWDRRRRGDEAGYTSCWVRVMQSVAGSWGGAWFVPRIGDEVLVAFLDGDPDRPVVVGSLYNSSGTPPWSLPDNKTRSGLRSRSSKQGGRDNANIIGFDDEKGKESLYLQAEKDMTTLVKHDRKTTVKNADTLIVESADRSVTLEEGNLATEIKQGNETRKIVQGDRKTTLTSGGDTLELSQGDVSIKCSLGSVTIEAMQKITLKVGQSTVVLEQSGVTVKGMVISAEGQATATLKSPSTTVSGDGMLTLSGGIVKIN